MSQAAVLLGLAVIMHVTWNLLARHVDVRCNYLWWGLLAHLLLLGPLGVYGLWFDAHWSWSLLGWMTLTALANSLYFTGLRYAYAQAPAAFVYPLARSSPLLIVLWTGLFWGEWPSLGGLIGILISIVGLWLLASTSRGNTQARAALPWIALAALCTSLYSLSDKQAISALPSFAAVIGYVSLGYLAAFILLSLLNLKRVSGHDRVSIIPPCRPPWRYLLVGGLCIGTSYALIIMTMQLLPAAYAVAFANAGIVLASVWSMIWMHERTAWRQRLLAAGLIALGLLVLALTV